MMVGTDTATFNRLTNQSSPKLSLADLNYALEHNEKFENLPDTIETNLIYRLSLASNTKDAYKSDPYSWKHSGSIPYPKNNPEFMKIYYSCINAEKKKDGRCVKHVYISKKSDYDVLVYYRGNLDIATKHPHGNSQLINAHVFHHTPASTIQQIDELVTKMPGDAAYKTLIATNGGEDAPRNSSQCRYRRQKFLKSQKITQDEMKNLILLSYELDGFYKSLQVQPHLIIILMHDQMKQQFSNLLKVSKEKIPLYYDTTFSLGEIFVSILAFRHVMFSERPILPLAILMHDTKRSESHNHFVYILSSEIPDLHKKCVLVTDCEIALKNAFQAYYPAMLQLRCWNHGLKNLKLAAKKCFRSEQQINAADEIDDETDKREAVANLMDMIKDLLRLSSRADFLMEYENISTSLPRQFREYFEKNYLPTIDELGGWSSRPLNLFDEISGVTNNPGESLNAVFKRWLSWKELSLDALVQMFYLVLGFYVNEVRRGFCGYGDYHLETTYNDSKTDKALLTLVSGFSPDVAVQRMKSILLQQKKSQTDINSQAVATENQLSTVTLDDKHDDPVQQQLIQETNHDQNSVNFPSQDNQNSIQQKTLTNTARATLVLEEGLVRYDVSSKAFTVRSLDHLFVHAVHMNDPKRLFRCSCPSTLQSCSHILAVKLFLGMPTDKCDNNVNLGHERKRKRTDDKKGKPGGKRPLRCDKEKKQENTSPNYPPNQINTTNVPQTYPGDMTSQVNAPINPPLMIHALTDVSNLPSSSTSTVNVVPKLVKAIRFLTPINVNVPLQQSNQYVVLKPS